MAKKAQPKNRVLTQDPSAPPRPPIGSTMNERAAEAAQRIQAIPSVDAGLSAPRGISSPIGGLPLVHNYLGRSPQSPIVRPEDRAPFLSRPIGSTETRGHNAAAALSAEVDRHVAMFGRVLHPAEATVAVERRAGRMQDVGLGTDIQDRDKKGLQAKQQIAAIATPGGLEGSRRVGELGALAGKPEDTITAAGLVEERLTATESMMKGSEVRPPRAAGVAKFGISEAPSYVPPKTKEQMGLVTVSKGKVETVDGRERLVPGSKKTTMTVAEHTKRAEKKTAKRKAGE